MLKLVVRFFGGRLILYAKTTHVLPCKGCKLLRYVNLITERISDRICITIMVIITVNAYVFYSLYVVNGSAIMNAAEETSVIAAINRAEYTCADALCRYGQL